MKKVAGISRWMHLLYLGNLLWAPVFDPAADWADWTLVAVVVVAFVPMYVLAWHRTDLVRWRCLVPTVVLGALATPFNTGAAVLFVYAGAFAGLAESRRVAMRWFVGLTALIGVFAVVSTVEMPYRLWGLLPSLIFLWLIGILQVEWAERDREAAELRIRTARVEHLATLAERERIARDLHDLLGHTLTAIVLRAQLVAADPARAQEEAAEIERAARAALGEIRDAVTGWRSASLETELEAARAALTSLGVEVVVRRDPDLTIVGSTEHELALALREAVTNVARHARAKTCHIGIEARDGELCLVIADDGIGNHAPEGNGLTGMRERIAALGGLVRRTGSAGTTVTIAVPLRVAT
ncbi:sensor histidine kinase [Lentzea sp. NEAU-D13]|uniref:Sensor histidine kinase n=1 Tax=Lentzea alba TaxID=2714351 RepID=A0A7C9RWK3_9PSEU|nr:histidine kinase [Lentzea alba]NGY64644.1 sensor histidine kinase [Lentzea alba]